MRVRPLPEWTLLRYLGVRNVRAPWPAPLRSAAGARALLRVYSTRRPTSSEPRCGWHRLERNSRGGETDERAAAAIAEDEEQQYAVVGGMTGIDEVQRLSRRYSATAEPFEVLSAFSGMAVYRLATLRATGCRCVLYPAHSLPSSSNSHSQPPLNGKERQRGINREGQRVCDKTRQTGHNWHDNRAH